LRSALWCLIAGLAIVAMPTSHALAEVKTNINVSVTTFDVETGRTEVLGDLFAKGRCSSLKRKLTVVAAGSDDAVASKVVDKVDTPRGFEFIIDVAAPARSGSYEVVSPATRSGCGAGRSERFHVD
jgi:hypothetical protein